MTKKITDSLLKNPPIFTQEFTSSDQSIVNGTTITVPHGLGAQPTLVRYFLECTTAEAGYAVGDRVDVNNVLERFGSNAAQHYGLSVASNNTNIYIVIGSNGIQIMSRASNAIVDITTSNWKIYCQAWL